MNGRLLISFLKRFIFESVQMREGQRGTEDRKQAPG